jgi:hypothetical protein
VIYVLICDHIIRALRKTSHILAALARLVTHQASTAPITYYALDLEKRELQRTLEEIQTSSIGNLLKGKVNTRGICGTYDDGLKYLSEGGLHNFKATADYPYTMEPTVEFNRSMSPDSTHSSESESHDTLISDTTPPSSPGASSTPLHVMFLGSSLGNFTRSGAVEFLRGIPLRPGSGDTLLIGLDHDNDGALIEKAYNDPHGCTQKFIKNGLRAAGRVLGDEYLFNEENWEYSNNYDSVSSRIYLALHLILSNFLLTQTERRPRPFIVYRGFSTF